LSRSSRERERQGERGRREGGRERSEELRKAPATIPLTRGAATRAGIVVLIDVPVAEKPRVEAIEWLKMRNGRAGREGAE